MGHDETGVATEIDTMLVGPVAPGDRLLVHAGTAIARIDAEQAT
jgi:hydrogenase assembly chaperone HypC/HupF